MAADVPEQGECAGQPQARLCLAGFGRPGEGLPQVVVLGLQPVQPDSLLRAGQLRLGLLRQGQEVVDGAASGLGKLAAGRQQLLSKRSDGLQHGHPRFGRVRILPP